jgi:class 3 adenylate cyclase
MASRLEAATKQYGVPLLISGALFDICTDEIKALCREIDTVTVKGSIQPIRLFTLDLDYDNLKEKADRF